METPRLLLDVRNVVGESAVWDDRRQCLWWVDIGGNRIHRLEQYGGEHVSFATPDRPTSIGLTADDRLIVGLMKQVALWTPGGDFETLAEIEPDLADNRLNEGQVAPDGSYWVGTMQNNLTAAGEPKPIAGRHGQLWRVAPNGDSRLAAPERFGITNTMIWLDGGRFVTADTLDNALFSYAGGNAQLRERTAFSPAFPRGLPDGSCLDAEGFIWNCRVAGGGCLVRFAPDGRIDRVLDLPCTSPTSCAFGGADLKTLFVTSARFGLSFDHLEAHPHEGGLFCASVGVRGRPARRFGQPASQQGIG